MLHPDFRQRRRGSPSMGEVGGERVRLGLGTGESETESESEIQYWSGRY